MARLGTNPNRTNKAQELGDTVLTCVTHLPNLDGYHSHRLEVVMTCLESMRGRSSLPVVIWDNGSCDTMKDWIRNEYKPDIFIESFNIGKTQAQLALARMLTGKVMAYCDDDIFFYPDWFTSQMEVFRKYPNVACVTGYPVRTAFRWGCENTKAWGLKHGKMQVGKFIPREWENDFCVSIQRDPQSHEIATMADFDYLLEYNGVKAFATSHHCQFIADADAVTRASQNNNDSMGDERPFDIKMDILGLRLATVERTSRHIGNVIDDKLRADISHVWKPQ